MKIKYLLAIVALTSVAACSKSTEQASGGGEDTAAAGGDKVDMKAAKAFFSEQCTVCHGESGKGDGPGATADPKPRDFTDKAWQGSVDDDHISKTILGGGAAVGKSPIMTAFPQLNDKPKVVAGLVKVVRGFGK